MPPKKYNAKAPIIDTNQKHLVIVESPAKAKTIKKYLGSGYEVTASMGHIADLAKGNGAIDIENNFQPDYEVSQDKKNVVTALKKAAKSMETVWIATDEDREGEAIGWHLCRELNLDIAKTPRIVFHEITKDAIEYAVSHPRTIDIDLVNAQQARRVLDRLVGFELSPVLRKKVKTGLSAGRVQSVAVKLLVEKEREIQKFQGSSAFKITADFLTASKEILNAEYQHKIDDEQGVEKLFNNFSLSTFKVEDAEQKPGTKNPSPPFTTSGLQQGASTKLGFSVSKTMQLAQRLYEAGHITYMRTDSLSISKQAIASAKQFITKEFGAEYSKTRQFITKSKGAQQAHECIRPTNMSQRSAGADEAQKKLYQLIWQRTIASQMSPAKVNRTTITIQPSKTKQAFIAKGEVVTFEGFLKVYDAKDKANQGILPSVKVGETLLYKQIIAQQVYDKPTARYTEASLVKKLEELGIGRPSTYAPTISTIQKRGYVQLGMQEGTPTNHAIAKLQSDTIQRTSELKKLGSTKGKLVPTDIGIVVTDFLDEHFESIMDYQFTASVEEEFDIIAQGKLQWQDMIRKFYKPFHDTVSTVAETAERASGERELGVDPVSGKKVLVRIGRYGPLVQIGEQGEEDLQYASLPPGIHMETCTLEEALTSFALPRTLGERQGKPVKASLGRFGPYVQRGSVFGSIKSPDDPYEIELPRAIQLLEEKIAKDKENTFQTFIYKDKEGSVMKSRWSNVIKRNRKTIKLPKGTKGESISHDEIFALIDSEIGSKKKAPSKKAPSKKAPAKKKPSTKKKIVAKKKPVAKKK